MTPDVSLEPTVHKQCLPTFFEQRHISFLLKKANGTAADVEGRGGGLHVSAFEHQGARGEGGFGVALYFVTLSSVERAFHSLTIK